MLTSELNYPLPEELIAQRPREQRDGARLLVVEAKDCLDARVADWPELVPTGALVVLNNTRVRKARLFAQRKQTGGKVEVLLLRPEPSGCYAALCKSNRPLRHGDVLTVGESELQVVGRNGGLVSLACRDSFEDLAAEYGCVPLPPYVRRESDTDDVERYQTVFAERTGSAAAPTAGLHLTHKGIARMGERGVSVGFVTLHVGAGTFRPVTSPTLDGHQMHSEQFELTEELVASIEQARAEGRPIVAVGTTVVRALEAAAAHPTGFRPGSYETSLLIQPGYQFRVVDALLTNFHAPCSTLLALVFAFAGRVRAQQAYADAVRRRYRFLSYGDAMWIPQRFN